MIINLEQAYHKKILHSISSSVESQKNAFVNPIKTYLLEGNFEFFKNPAFLFHENQPVVINKYGLLNDLALVDIIQGKNWDIESQPVISQYSALVERENLPQDGLCLIGTQWGNSNIFHLLYDSIGKITILEKFFNIDDLTFLIPEGVENFKNILKAFNLKYLIYKTNKIYYGKFLIPSMTSYFGASSYDTVSILNKLSNRIIDSHNFDYDCIYISRKKVNTRHIINEDELITYLNSKMKFKLLYLEDLCFQDEISIFKNAKLIVAPHGAGLTWSIFQRAGVLIEIFSPHYVNNCFGVLLRNPDVKYHAFYSNPEIKLNYNHPEFSLKNHTIDMNNFSIFFENIIQ